MKSLRRAVKVETGVAPHWGAWIEIQRRCASRKAVIGRTPLGCVD